MTKAPQHTTASLKRGRKPGQVVTSALSSELSSMIAKSIKDIGKAATARKLNIPMLTLNRILTTGRAMDMTQWRLMSILEGRKVPSSPIERPVEADFPSLPHSAGDYDDIEDNLEFARNVTAGLFD